MENPIKMDDLGIPLFLETPICYNTNRYPQESKPLPRIGFFGFQSHPKRIGM